MKKKCYLAPTEEIYAIRTSSFVAESFGTNKSFQDHKVNMYMGNGVAEVKEDNSCMSSNVWDNEW